MLRAFGSLCAAIADRAATGFFGKVLLGLCVLIAASYGFGLSDAVGIAANPYFQAAAFIVSGILTSILIVAAYRTRKPILGEITAREALHYLVEDSAWGMRQLLKLKYYTPIYISSGPRELVEKARDGDISVRGVIGFSPIFKEISKDYWQNAQIDVISVTGRGNSPGRTEVLNSFQGLPIYEDLRLPKAKVSEIWPRANPVLRLAAIVLTRIQWRLATGQWSGEG